MLIYYYFSFIQTPKKLRLLQEIEADVEDSGITVETPLISSIPTALQVRLQKIFILHIPYINRLSYESLISMVA